MMIGEWRKNFALEDGEEKGEGIQEV